MPTEAHPVSEARSRRDRRRRATVVIVRSLVVSTALVIGYFVLPFDSPLAMDTGLGLAAGLAVITGLLAWQIREILRSALPAVQAVAALALTIPMFLILFATTYYMMSDADASRFSEPLTRLDALYFTVTTFATVGFGDITAVSEPARAVATIQMVLGLVLVGLIARVILSAVEVARSRQHTGQDK